MADLRCWSKDRVTSLIKLYRDNPCLWKVKSKEYVNKHLKNEAYVKLVNFCKPTFPEADRDFVVKKIQSLRGSFRKELRKVIERQRSGVPLDEAYTPSLWYYDLLLFTKDQETSDFGADSNEDYEQDDDETTRQDDSCNNGDNLLQDVKFESETFASFADNAPASFADNTLAIIEGHRGKKRKTMEADTQTEIMKACTSTTKISPTEISEFEAIGVNVTKKLQRMDPVQALHAECLIQEVLRKGLLRSLSENTIISENHRIYQSTSTHANHTS
ncbi:uncharacterized protein [Periplaneta americana]|uniref:uncharacterized protein n=1 Tax=Periplaneta americana TaxID=6978 RepID=UPI0037E7774F